MAVPIDPRDQRGPVPHFAEVQSTVYEWKVGRNVLRQGRRQAEEGLINGDLSIRGQYYEGVREGELTSSGHNMPYRRQSPAQTVSQRARMGGAEFHINASWVDVGGYLAGFAMGTAHDGEQRYEVDRVNGRRYGTSNEARIREA